MTLKEFVAEIDWGRLRKQKQLLLGLVDSQNIIMEQGEELDGVIHLLDDLQDVAVDELGLSKTAVFGESENDNCLERIKCPVCGNEKSFVITVTTPMTFSDDGADRVGDTDWDRLSDIECTKCHHTGQVWEFTA